MLANIQDFLQLMLEGGASDLHITQESPPLIRVHGELKPLAYPPLTANDTRTLCYSLLTEAQKKKFEEENELDKLGLPNVVVEMASLPRGLVLVTGPTGSGKTTTLAAIIDRINNSRPEHIITIEDPIEFVHGHKRALVNQREVFADTLGFAPALKHILRQDPDIVLIGEMRDLETIEAALVVAETGHLVFSTLHTNSAVQTINRVIDVFPPHQQEQVRAQLSLVLQGVVSQQLLPRIDGRGRCLAAEIMIPNAAIRNLIREAKVHQLYSQMQVGQQKWGMQTMSQSLLDLHLRRLITSDEALGHATEPEEMKMMLAQNPSAGPRAAVRR